MVPLLEMAFSGHQSCFGPAAGACPLPGSPCVLIPRAGMACAVAVPAAAATARVRCPSFCAHSRGPWGPSFCCFRNALSTWVWVG